MNKQEAKRILAEHLAKYRTRPYADLQRLLHEQDMAEVTAPSGTWYQIEVQAFWDDKPNGNLRVMGSIDDGGWRAFVPLTDSFIMTPDGRFVGE